MALQAPEEEQARLASANLRASYTSYKATKPFFRWCGEWGASRSCGSGCPLSASWSSRCFSAATSLVEHHFPSVLPQATPTRRTLTEPASRQTHLHLCHLPQDVERFYGRWRQQPGAGAKALARSRCILAAAIWLPRRVSVSALFHRWQQETLLLSRRVYHAQVHQHHLPRTDDHALCCGLGGATCTRVEQTLQCQRAAAVVGRLQAGTKFV